MAKSDLLNAKRTGDTYETYTETDELVTDAGSTAFILGDIKRAFIKTGLTIYTGASETGDLLVEDVDYEIINEDFRYTELTGYNCYVNIRILTIAYQSGNLYITYQHFGSYTDSSTVTSVIESLTEINQKLFYGTSESNYATAFKRQKTLNTKYGFWGEVLWDTTTTIVIKPKSINGFFWIGCILNNGKYLELTTNQTITLDVTTLDKIGAIQANSFYYITGYENSGGALEFDLSWMPLTTIDITAGSPTTAITLDALGGVNVGYCFAPASHFVVWEDTDEFETLLGVANGGAFSYDATPATELTIASRTATILTLSKSLAKTDFATTAQVYQVSNFQPLAADDGLIADAIGARGWLDIGIRLFVNGSSQIQRFKIDDNKFLFSNGTGAADVNAQTGGLGTVYSASGNYLLVHVPPDKNMIGDTYATGAGGAVGFLCYMDTYSQLFGNCLSNGYVHSNFMNLHKILSLDAISGTTYNIPIGYEI